MELKIVFVLLAVTLVSRCSGYSTGAPRDACDTMFPSGHSVVAQTTTPPYTITVDKAAYTLGDSLSVTVAGSGAKTFKGIFVQARVANYNCTGDLNDAPQGIFEIPNTTTGLKLVTCGSTENALTHMSPAAKTTKTFTWKAPATDVGTIYFRATVVESKEVFWEQLSSGFIKSPANNPDPVECTAVDTTPVPVTEAPLPTPKSNETNTEAPMPNTTSGVERINISFLFVLFCSVLTLLGFC